MDVCISVTDSHSMLPSTLSQNGTKAPQAAGRIHSDFERGFIMAEVSEVACI